MATFNSLSLPSPCYLALMRHLWAKGEGHGRKLYPRPRREDDGEEARAGTSFLSRRAAVLAMARSSSARKKSSDAWNTEPRGFRDFRDPVRLEIRRGDGEFPPSTSVRTALARNSRRAVPCHADPTVGTRGFPHRRMAWTDEMSRVGRSQHQGPRRGNLKPIRPGDPKGYHRLPAPWDSGPQGLRPRRLSGDESKVAGQDSGPDCIVWRRAPGPDGEAILTFETDGWHGGALSSPAPSGRSARRRKPGGAKLTLVAPTGLPVQRSKGTNGRATAPAATPRHSLSPSSPLLPYGHPMSSQLTDSTSSESTTHEQLAGTAMSYTDLPPPLHLGPAKGRRSGSIARGARADRGVGLPAGNPRQQT
ncbi:hypothetical protein B2J93_1947 [Marssonina coronariae]|uniref:Uncharacterized protein n=1 Tax=Diplocarpon coronariae TaxID=2795749 RepID=A0A218ZHE0_9HELO|nr:hypothetical protein B2J93_1947 [Marssonina coronariae]